MTMKINRQEVVIIDWNWFEDLISEVAARDFIDSYTPAPDSYMSFSFTTGDYDVAYPEVETALRALGVQENEKILFQFDF